VPQRIRAEAAERSRLSRKADRAVQRESNQLEQQDQEPQQQQQQQQQQNHPQHQQQHQQPQHQQQQHQQQHQQPQPQQQQPPPQTLKAKRRETAMREVELKLETWRRKRARAEAGLPEEPDGHSAQHIGAHLTGFPARRHWMGDGEAGMGMGAQGGKIFSGPPWPEVFNAIGRRGFPNEGPGAPGAFSCLGGGGGGGGGGGEEEDDCRERWTAPWMLGCVERSAGGGSGRSKGYGSGNDCGTGNDCGNDCGNFCGNGCGNNCGIICGNSCGNSCGKRGARGRGIQGVGLTGEGAGAVVGLGGGAGGDGRGARAGGERLTFSDLHHEILKFSEYVSLTPAEV
ncbi:unnamed protein product, partial [Laminaria digitata]